MAEGNKKYFKINVTGENGALFEKLKSAFLSHVEKILDTQINFDEGKTIKQEAKEFSSALIKHAKEKLAKATYENEKTVADVDLIYTSIEKEKAETRKINAEARLLEFELKMKEMQVILGAFKMLILNSDNQEEIIFIKGIEQFLETIKMLEMKNE